MALTPEQLAELQRLKQMYAPLVEAQRRRDQADANAQKMGIPLTPPDKKAKGGLENSKAIKGAVVKIGDRLFVGRTHGDALNRAIYEGVVRKQGGKYIYPKDQDLNMDLFIDKDGKLIDRFGAYFNYDIGASETAIEKGMMQNRPASSISVDDFKRGNFKASGGSIPSMDVMRLAIGGQGPKNWLKGSVENVIAPLTQDTVDDEHLAGILKASQNPKVTEASRQEMANVHKEEMHRRAMNQWVERNLANYIRKQMATHDDPIRKLAEQGIIHMPTEQVGLNRYKAADRRRQLGEEQLGQSEEAKAWEDATDVAFHRTNVGNIMGHPDARKRNGEPWMEKADPKTHLYYPSDSMHAHYLGFDHLVDILKEDLAEGRIRPEQLSKVSIEHAVRRAHEYDQEKKRKMAETALKATEGMPVHKDYGDGFKWIELAMPKELPEGYSQTPAGTYVDPEGKQSIHHPNYGKLEDALKYEGDTMGHCVGGYCPDVASGKTRIFSLRDAKNEPHVTIEVGKPQARSMPDEMNRIYDQAHQEANAKNFNTTAEFSNFYHNRVNELHMDMMRKKRDAMPPAIKQIKGKQNAKPKKDYIPYVQDFVKSGKWSEVGDLHNTELKHLSKVPERKQLESAGMQLPEYLSDKDHDELINEYNRRTKPPFDPDFFEKTYGKADGGEVDAESAFFPKFKE